VGGAAFGSKAERTARGLRPPPSEETYAVFAFVSLSVLLEEKQNLSPRGVNPDSSFRRCLILRHRKASKTELLFIVHKQILARKLSATVS
jgi:hypothetical protein